MENNILDFFYKYAEYAFFISILINIMIAILGVIPSYFLTAANLFFFGLYQGVFVSFLGEAIGAVVSFILYRKGLKRVASNMERAHPRLKKLRNLKGKEGFYAVFTLRLMPFIPSGIITMAFAIGEISLIAFAISSSLGKIPALLIEGYSVYQIINFSWQGKIILLLLGAFIIGRIFKGK